MEVKELVKALLCCTGSPRIKDCKERCRYFRGGNMNKCIPDMGKDVASAMESMQEELDRVKAERDVAVEDLQIHGGCGICKHGYYEPVMGGICCDTKPKNGWISNKNGQKINRCIIFEWRGLEGRKEL